ncbi:MAG: GTPase HflX, partial [Cyclobacteriaceae bacterium]
SHPAFEEQINVVRETLRELKAEDKPTLYVFNKIDQLEKSEDDSDERFEYLRPLLRPGDQMVFISALKKQNIKELRKTLFKMVRRRHYEIFPNYINPDPYHFE